MGLDCTFDAFHGAYSAFSRFRKAVAQAMGGSYPPHDPKIHADGTVLDDEAWYWGDGYSRATHPGLYCFLSHSDCDGDIPPALCVYVADELEALLPAIEKAGLGDGHILRGGGYAGVTETFIKGCRAAAAAGQPLEFL